MFWLECILGLDNGIAAASLYFQEEREESSQSTSDLRIMLILFGERSAYVYIYIYEFWKDS